MPYIQVGNRTQLDPVLEPLLLKVGDKVWGAGDLNYVITKIVLAFVKGHGENYAHYNDVIGALECAKLELYRRRIACYEDGKIATNGDVQ